MVRPRRCLLGGCLALAGAASAAAGEVELAHPVMFVTQVPVRADFATIGSTFANHQAGMQSVGRGGDLWIRYPDGTLRNLTAEAGYGSDGFQGDRAIAVRDPAVHWSGDKAVFSMVVGGPSRRYEYEDYFWRLYEVTGLGPDDTAVITEVAKQPAGSNHVSPIYGTDDRILFTSDMGLGNAGHLKQRDEYELTPVVSGLWRLDPESGELEMLNHAPSGNFTPAIDSYGRVVFTQWDHLVRDQLADADAGYGSGQNCDAGTYYGTFDYASEAADAAALFGTRVEVFPEPRSCRDDLLAGTNLVGHDFNHFFPWTIEEDGSGGEVLSHLGRHELHHYLNRSIDDDPNVVEFYGQYPRTNGNSIQNLFQVEEDPTLPGRYWGTEAPEFGTHASGQIVYLDAPPTLNPDAITVTDVTHPDTGGTTPSPEHSGHYRSPTPLSDGNVVVVHTAEQRAEASGGGPLASRYDFRLKLLADGPGEHAVAGEALTPGISKTLSYWDPDTLVTYSGPLWELDPVEVRARTRPARTPPSLEAPEQQLFDAAGIDVAEFRAALAAQGLALAVVRDATTRDDLDRQQPFHLRVPGGDADTRGARGGPVYDVAFLQLFQGDLLRGSTGGSGTTPRPGRRVLARALHEPAALAGNPNPGGPPGSVSVFPDGSIAALVPARRAMTWQLTDPAGTPVVRERYWVTFQPGEIRVCGSCHGVNDVDQEDAPPPVNAPLALAELLARYVPPDPLFSDDFERGDTSAWSEARHGDRN